jgi:hypothetical protein
MKGFIASACVLILSTGVAFAQWGECGCCCEEICCPEDQACFYAGAEWLFWKVKAAPVPIPLVTTSTSPTGAGNGVIGNPNTALLFGNQTIDYPYQSGFRASAGVLPCCDCPVGIEGSGFLIPKAKQEFNFFSNGAGSPLIAEPFRNAPNNMPDGEASLVLAAPGVFAGGVRIDSSVQLWGSEANVVIGSGYSLLVGARYVDLEEKLDITGVRTTLANGNMIAGNDGFGTRNQFCGGQIGFRVAQCWGPVFLGAQAKIALGDTQETVTIAGNTTVSTPGAVTLVPGGLFAVRSNIGGYRQNQFAFVPEGEVRVGVNLGCHVTIYAGWDFLYWSQVVRPGDQISRNINEQQILGGGLTTGTQPSFTFKSTDFTAQGASVGIEFRF